MEKLIVRKLGADIDLVDRAILQMLASPRKPLLYKHVHWDNKDVYCLHIPVLVIEK